RARHGFGETGGTRSTSGTTDQTAFSLTGIGARASGGCVDLWTTKRIGPPCGQRRTGPENGHGPCRVGGRSRVDPARGAGRVEAAGGAADEMVPHSSRHQTRRCRKSCLHLPGAPQRSQLTRGFPEPHRHQEVRSVSSYSVDNDDHPRTAAFFDLDKTIIAKSSTLAFSRSFYQGGLINRRAVLRSAYAQFV